MKKYLPAVKAAVLFCAAVTVILRFILYKYDAAIPQEAKRVLGAVSAVAAAILLLSGVVWVLTERAGKKGT